MMLIIAGLLFMGKRMYELKLSNSNVNVQAKQAATVHVYHN